MAGRVLVIGGGAAGMSAASAARRVDPRLEVVVLERSGYAAYGMCGIPYLLEGLVERGEQLLSHPPEDFRERRGIDLRLHTEAVAINLARRAVDIRQVAARPTSLRFDRLIVTAGAAPVLPRLPGLDDERVFTLRTLEDAIALRGLLDSGRVARAVVVGGGYVGLETAEALRLRGADVTVVEAEQQVMTTLDRPIAAQVEAEVRRHTTLRLGTTLREVRRIHDAMHAVVQTDGSPPDAVPADVVVIAVGVRPGSQLLADVGASTGPAGALVVDDQMRTSLDDVLAAGDCVAPHHRVLGRPAYVPLGPAANKTGRVAGTVAAGGQARFAGIVGSAVCKVFDLAVGRTGLTLAEAEREGLPALATDVVSRSRAKYYPGTAALTVRLVHGLDGKLLGAQLVGSDGVAKRVDVLATALHAGFSLTDVADLDLTYAPPFAPVRDPVLAAAEAAQRSRRLAPA